VKFCTQTEWKIEGRARVLDYHYPLREIGGKTDTIGNMTDAHADGSFSRAGGLER